MLLSFSVGNFRSFRAEQTLSLLASKRLGATDDSPHCCAVPGTGEHALRVASLYGANGAGKSNLVRSLGLLGRLVLHGTPPGKPIPYKPFLLDDESSGKPTSIEVQFLEQGEVFGYGICFDSEAIREEGLSVYETNKSRDLFTRVTTADGNVAVELGSAADRDKLSSKMKALAEVGARPNQLFMTEVVNLDDAESQGARFHRAIRWFASTLAVIPPDASFLSLAKTIASDETFAEFAGRFLREASTGISGLEVKTEELPDSKAAGLPARLLASIFEELPRGEVVVLPGSDGGEMIFERVGKETVKRRHIVALHDRGKLAQAALPLQEESDGSRRLLNLLPALYRLTAEGSIFVIDELERSMHPMLARKFIEFFLKAPGGANSQLIFTTHESTLLDLDLMRRDGVWFAEKDQEGATQLYSLADFKVRKDLRIEKGYLQGRFGAVPFLGGIDQLIEEQSGAEASG